jgi:hypothetical protein
LESPEVERYVSVLKAVEEALRSLGGSAELDALVEEVWKRWGGKAPLRVYRHPSGRLWSPDVDEALKVLSAAGIVRVVGRKVNLQSI